MLGPDVVGTGVAIMTGVRATGIWIDRPLKRHALDTVEGGLALDRDVLDAGHQDRLELMFASVNTGCSINLPVSRPRLLVLDPLHGAATDKPLPYLLT